MLKQKKTLVPIYIYLHFHWDREWFLTFSTARALLQDRVKKTLSALESGELPNFYLDGQAVVLEDLIEIDPDLAPRIKKAMSLGKISAGPWYVLPDQSLIGGESLVRNLKLGIEITRRFGPPTMTGYNPDTFCHVQDLPRVLKGMEIETAFVLRGVPPLPGTNIFWWDSPDGSRVLTYFLNKGLTHQIFHKSADENDFASELNNRWELDAVDANTAPMLYSVGGEGMQPPGDIDGKLERLNAILPEHCKAKVVSMTDFIKDLERWAKDKDLPVVKGDLRDNRTCNERFPAYVLDGVSSTRLHLKRDNVFAEHRLGRITEPLFAMLHAQGIMEYPERELTHAWKLLIQNHPHDSICGCSVDAVHQEMKTRTQQLNSFLDGLDILASESIAEQRLESKSTNGKGHVLPEKTGLQPEDPDNGLDRLLIYNTSGYSHKAPARISWYADPEKPLELPSSQIQVDKDTLLSNQLFHSPGGFYYKKVRKVEGWIYPEKEVPALGFSEAPWGDANDRLGPTAQSKTNPGLNTDAALLQSAGAVEIANGLFSCTVSDKGDLIVSTVGSGAPKQFTLGHDIYDVGDGGDSYNFDPLANDKPIRAKFVSVKAGKSGPLVSSLFVNYEIDIPAGLDTDVVADEKFEKGRSSNLIKHTIETEISIKKGLSLLFFDTRFDNRSADHRLSVRFRTGPWQEETWSEYHFSVAKLPKPAPCPDLPVPVGYEIPPESYFSQRFFIADGQIFLNRGLPEYRVKEDYVEITLLRGVSWLSRGRLRTRGGGAGPWDATPEANCFGANRCEYAWSFLPSFEGKEPGDEQIAQAYKLADLFEGRLVSFALGKSRGTHEQSILTIDNPAVYLTALFVDRGKLCLRLLNTSLAPQKTSLKVALPVRSAEKTNLLGELPQSLPLLKETNDAKTVILEFGVNELLTVAFELKL